MNLDSLLADAVDAAQEAGSVIQDIRAGVFEKHEKTDQSPVTAADHAADALLKERLLSRLSCAWLSEETADTADRLTASRLWVVDPLDGTKEFIKGLPEYAVAIALVEDRRPVLGVVHNPATGELFAAVRGGGATKNGERVVVRDGDRLLASRTEIARGEFEPFAADWHVVPMGSIEYKLGVVGAGEAAVTFSRGPKHEWDVCAGAIIVEEAGGRVTDLFGDPLLFNGPFPKCKGILAGAPEAYERAIDRLGETGASDRMGEFTDVSPR